MSLPMQTGAHLGILAVSLAGFFALALATERHAEHLLGRLPATRWRLLARIAGRLLLAASLAWAIAALGTGIGITLWLGWLTIAALAWVFIFPKWPLQSSAREKPMRKVKAQPDEFSAVTDTRTRRRIAAGLLALTIAGFSIALTRVQAQPFKHRDAIQGSVAPWQLNDVKADLGAPNVLEMDVSISQFCSTSALHLHHFNHFIA